MRRPTEDQMAQAMGVSQPTIHKRAKQIGLRCDGQVGFSKVEQLMLACCAELIEAGIPAAQAGAIVKTAKLHIADLFVPNPQPCWLIVSPCQDSPDGFGLIAVHSVDDARGTLEAQPTSICVILHAIVQAALEKLMLLKEEAGNA